jgi:hypothetical protein
VYFCCIRTYQDYKENIVNYFIEKNLITIDPEEDESAGSERNSVIKETSELNEESYDDENKVEFLIPTPRNKPLVKKLIDTKGIMLGQVYSFEEFMRIFNSISNTIKFTSDSLEVIFDRY